MSGYSPGVGKLDVAIVDRIETDNGRMPYVVLGPQMVSAAALRKFGFERDVKFDDRSVYPFAIPTGDVLYAHYLDLFRKHSPAEIRELFSHLNVNRIYVVMPVIWDPNGVIKRSVRSSTDTSFTDDGFDVYVFDRK